MLFQGISYLRQVPTVEQEWKKVRVWRTVGIETPLINFFFISFSIFIYPGDPAETCVTNINHQSSNDGKICLAHVTRSIIRGGSDGDGGGGVVVINEYRKWLFFHFSPLPPLLSEPDHALKAPPWGESSRRVAGGTRRGWRRRRINKNPLARLVDVLL